MRSLASSLRWSVRRAGVRLSRHDVRLAAGVRVYPSARFETRRGPGEYIEVGRDSEIHRGAILATYGGRIVLGEQCSVNPYCVLLGHGGLEVGNFVRIAPHTVIAPMNHVYEDPGRPIVEQGVRHEGIRIEDDVWVGANATILDGCTVGVGSVIAAGAVVTRSVPSYTVVAGCPAKVIKRRGAR
jgi:acetyltransferase-like isoleucine patch superfamily enzyme